MAETRPPWWLWPLLVVLLPLVIVAGVLWLMTAVLLLLVVWLTWCPRGRYVLVFYSESPIWREYFEQNVIPVAHSRSCLGPLAWPRRFRFYRPFQAFKHGRPQEVEDMRRDLLNLLDGLAPRPRAE